MDQISHLRIETIRAPSSTNIIVTDCFHRDEVELRAHTNIALQQNIDFITLHQWYNIFNVAGLKEVYLKPPPGIKNAKGSAFCLELFIHKDIVSFLSAFIYHPIHFHSTSNELVKMTRTRWMKHCRNPNLPRNEKGLVGRKTLRCPNELRVSLFSVW